MGELYIVGSLNVDLVSYMPAFPGPGETVMGTSFQQGPGGKGANQAAAAARLCTATERAVMVGMVGSDALGRDYLAPGGLFTSSGVDCSRVRAVEGVSTGCAPIFVNAAGENCIVVVPGANKCVDPSFVQSGLAGLSPHSSVLVQLEIPLEATLCALRCARSAGAASFLTPAPAPKGGLAPEFFTCASVLIPNEGEARALLGPTAAPLPLEEVAMALASKGPCAVCVTRGPRGALLCTPGRPPREVPAPKVRSVVDTTGAGDCFSGSLAYFYSRLLTAAAPAEAAAAQGAVDFDALVEAARRAAVVAALSVTRKGTQSSYAPRGDLPQELFVWEGWRHNPPALPTEV